MEQTLTNAERILTTVSLARGTAVTQKDPTTVYVVMDSKETGVQMVKHAIDPHIILKQGIVNCIRTSQTSEVYVIADIDEC